MTSTADAVVIGAGVIGSSVACELARTGRRVTVVEKLNDVAAGSTGFSSAVVRFHYSTWDGVVAAWESKFGWENWRQHVRAPASEEVASFVRTGVVILDSPRLRMERIVPFLDRLGIPCERWSSDDIRTRVPALDPRMFGPPKDVDSPAFLDDPGGELGAYYMPDAGFVDDPQLAARNLIDEARRHGAELRLRSEVIGIERRGDRVTGVRLAGGELISAPVVVNVSGPHSSRVNQMAGATGIRIGTRPLRQEVHSIPLPPTFGSATAMGPIVIDDDLGTYFRPHLDGRLLIGGTEPECDPLVWIDDPDTYGPHPTADVFNAQVLRAARRMPDVAVPPRPSGIAGLYDVADDWAPIYDRTDLDGYYVAIGTSGNQFKNAPTVGGLMSALIDAVEGGHDHDADPVRFRCRHIDHEINVGAYSRRREPNPASPMNANG
ncbi:NAD(P)/FAD-dependent oxidoreductase [Streptosporangium sp. NPDC004631]